MTADILVLPSWREAREAEGAAHHAMTVADLIEYLQGIDPEARVVVEGYDGHLFSGLTWEGLEEANEGGQE